MRLEQGEPFVRSQPLAVDGFLQDGGDGARHASFSKVTRLLLPAVGMPRLVLARALRLLCLSAVSLTDQTAICSLGRDASSSSEESQDKNSRAAQVAASGRVHGARLS